MINVGDASPSSRQPRDDSRRLARSLDRAVLLARASTVCVVAGRLVVATALAIIMVSACLLAGIPVPFPAGSVMVAATIGVAAWLTRRRWRWPDRLGTAMAIEAAHPAIGERISRAVPFLDEPSEDPDSTRSLLVRRAVTEAVSAIEGLSGDRLRSPARGKILFGRAAMRWPAAGLAVCAALAVSGMLAPDRLLRSLAEPFFGSLPTERPGDTVPAEPRSTLPSSVVAAARRLAEAAATEERLASALLARFASSPGADRETLSRVEQDWLDETAALQAAIADDIGRDLPTVVAAVVRTDPRLAADLAGEGLVRERTERLSRAAERIRGNQMAAAAGLVRSQVRPILAALRARGVVPADDAGLAVDRADLVRRRIVAAIEADGERLAAAAVSGGGEPERNGQAIVPAGQVGREPPRERLAPSSGGREPRSVASGTGGAAGSAAGGAGSGGGEPSAAGGGEIDAADRLPAWVRGRERRATEAVLGEDFATPPRYRAAVDDYYRRLWAAESRPRGDGEVAP